RRHLLWIRPRSRPPCRDYEASRYVLCAHAARLGRTMKKKPTGTRSRHLSEEDVYLWDHTTATLKPLKRKRGRVLANAEPVEDVPPRKVPAKSEPRTSAPPPKISRAPPPPAKPAHATPPPLSQFDRKAARRLRQGGIEIEARIDLHGMR